MHNAYVWWLLVDFSTCWLSFGVCLHAAHGLPWYTPTINLNYLHQTSKQPARYRWSRSKQHQAFDEFLLYCKTIIHYSPNLWLLGKKRLDQNWKEPINSNVQYKHNAKHKVKIRTCTLNFYRFSTVKYCCIKKCWIILWLMFITLSHQRRESTYSTINNNDNRQ